jgi:hypothetical protein
MQKKKILIMEFVIQVYTDGGILWDLCAQPHKSIYVTARIMLCRK